MFKLMNIQVPTCPYTLLTAGLNPTDLIIICSLSSIFCRIQKAKFKTRMNTRAATYNYLDYRFSPIFLCLIDWLFSLQIIRKQYKKKTEVAGRDFVLCVNNTDGNTSRLFLRLQVCPSWSWHCFFLNRPNIYWPTVPWHLATYLAVLLQRDSTGMSSWCHWLLRETRANQCSHSFCITLYGHLIIVTWHLFGMTFIVEFKKAWTTLKRYVALKQFR